jgi:hypothetical protein
MQKINITSGAKCSSLGMVITQKYCHHTKSMNKFKPDCLHLDGMKMKNI